MVQLNDTGYLEWELGIERGAYEIARDLIKDFNEGIRGYSYTTNQSKVVEKYKLIKVWNLLIYSGIYIDFRISKQKDRVRVRIIMESDEEE